MRSKYVTLFAFLVSILNCLTFSLVTSVTTTITTCEASNQAACKDLQVNDEDQKNSIKKNERPIELAAHQA